MPSDFRLLVWQTLAARPKQASADSPFGKCHRPGREGFRTSGVVQIVAINKEVAGEEDDVVAHDAFLSAKRANTSLAPEPFSLISAVAASDRWASNSGHPNSAP